MSEEYFAVFFHARVPAFLSKAGFSQVWLGESVRKTHLFHTLSFLPSAVWLWASSQAVVL